MDKSTVTGTLKSVTKATGTVGMGTIGQQSRGLRQQRTATSNRTGGVSSSAQTSVHYRPPEKIRPRVKIIFFQIFN